MAKIIEHRKFVLAASGINSNKVWEGILYDNGDVECRYGRVGKKMQVKLSPGKGRSYLDSKIREKTTPCKDYDGGCYKEIKTLESQDHSGEIVVKDKLKEIAKRKVGTCAVTKKLVEYFTEVNAHNITNATGGKISYNFSSGTLKTPLGIITLENINEARLKLVDIKKNITSKKLGKAFTNSVDDFLMLVPQDIGMKYDPISILGSVDKIAKQNDLLDMLEASYSSVVKSADGKTVDIDDGMFNVKMEVLDDKKEFDRIEKLFNKTKQQLHYGVYGMKISKIYKVNIERMTKEFDSNATNMPNIWELWHGTKDSNILSIINSGFKVSPPSTAYISGKAFGNGLYFSDQSTKSLNYCGSNWGGSGSKGSYFMFLNDVAMGNYYVPKSTTSSNPPAGYDSYFAKAGETGYIQNNEMIIFKEYQVKPKYLLEFK